MPPNSVSDAVRERLWHVSRRTQTHRPRVQRNVHVCADWRGHETREGAADSPAWNVRAPTFAEIMNTHARRMGTRTRRYTCTLCTEGSQGIQEGNNVTREERKASGSRAESAESRGFCSPHRARECAGTSTHGFTHTRIHRDLTWMRWKALTGTTLGSARRRYASSMHATQSRGQ